MERLLDETSVLPIGGQAAFLAVNCGDAAVRAEVESLLAIGCAATVAPTSVVGSVAALTDILESPGKWIAPYLLPSSGRRWDGVVYRAEQHLPVRRSLALKIVKPGMDSGQVIARFETERQSLARMDHPDIARVIDAGSTIGGHPYFVMESVGGAFSRIILVDSGP